MKKRLFTVFTLSVLLVGIMTAVAAAGDAYTTNGITGPASAVSIEAGKTGTASVTLTASKQSGSKVTAAAASGTISITDDADSGITITNGASYSFSAETYTQTLTFSVPRTAGSTAEAKSYALTLKESEANNTCTVTISVPQLPTDTAPFFYSGDVGTKLSDNAVKEAFGSLAYDTEANIVIGVSAKPACTALTITGLPTGLTAEVDKSEGAGSITVSGTPSVVVSKQEIVITAQNKLGKKVLKFKVDVDPGTAELLFTDPLSSDSLPTGDYKKGAALTQNLDEATKVTLLRAEPGPIVWKVKDLPAGIKTTESGDTDLVLSGTLNKITDFDKNGEPKKAIYKITATNKAMGETIEVENGLIVWDYPSISTTKLPDIATEKVYKGKLAFKNYPTSIDVMFSTDGTAFDYATVDSPFEPLATDGTTCGALYWDPESSMITGSFDKVPATDGGKIWVKVTVNNPLSEAEDKPAEKTFEVAVKGIKPVLAKPENSDLSEGEVIFYIDKGTAPISVDAYIEASVAKSLGLGSNKIEISSADPIDRLGLMFTPVDVTDGSHKWGGALTFTAGDSVDITSYKGLKVTLEAKNAATGETSSVKKQFTVSNNAEETPSWYRTSVDDEKITETSLIVSMDADGKLLAAGEPVSSEDLTFATDVLGPFTITPKNGTKSNGLVVTVNEADKTLSISGTPTKGKDTSTKFTLLAQNNMTKKKAQLKLTIMAFADPVVSNAKDLAKGKTVVAGKKLSIKPKVKVNKNITLSFDISDPDALEAMSMDINAETGEISAASAYPTVDENTGEYAQNKTLSIKIAGNFPSESLDVPVTIDVKPLQPKIKTSKMTIYKNAEDQEDGSNNIVVSNITAEMTASGMASVDISDADGGLEKLGLSITEITNDGTNVVAVVGAEDVTALEAKKGASVNITANNYGVTAKKKITFTIADPTPVISASENSLSLTADESKAVTNDSITVAVDSSTMTGESKMKWKVTKPSGVSGLSVKTKVNKDTNECQLIFTVKKGLKTDITDAEFSITATNTLTKETSDPATVTVSVTGIGETDGATKDGETKAEKDKATDTATDEAEKAMKEEDVEVGEGEVILGKARTEAALTATQRTAIAEAGYVVAAVLPEVEVTAAGQYPFAVEIPEEIAAGKELAWFAFSTKPSEDDEIVDFFDEEGKDTKVVPESHKITVYPWLNADVTYAPVIAVKADTGEKGAETEEQIKEKTVRAVKK